MSEVVAMSGAITLASVEQVRREMLGKLDRPDLLLDLGGVTEVDSTVVSLLLHWRRAAHVAKREISMRNVPDSVKSLATLYGVNELLPTIVD